MLKRTAEGRSVSTVWRAAFSATLTLSMGISPFAIFALSALSPMVVTELGFSRTGLGSVATVAFAVAALSSVAGGRQVDVFGGRAMLSWVFITGGAAAIVMAVAQHSSGCGRRACSLESARESPTP
jgi:nitrate/nitrite transporter NarK